MLIDLLMRLSSNQLLVREILRKRTTCALVFRRSETKKRVVLWFVLERFVTEKVRIRLNCN